MTWLERIDWCLDQETLRASQRKFLISIRNFVVKYPAVYPTLSQQCIAGRIYRSLRHKEEKALLGDCY